MSEKRLNNIRIVHKHETEANWLLSSLVPMQGELIVYDIDENYDYERIKIGDGVQNVNDLPFVTETVDWNDLLTRPLGEVPEYYVDQCTVECTDIHYLYVDAAKSVIIGETYTVIFDGVEYECECLNYKRFGNLSLYYDTEEDTGEPFLLRYDGMVNGYVLTVKETGTHTISIEQKVVEYIDEKYIPETIARVADLPSLEGCATESYVDDKITEFVGDTAVAEQIEGAITEFKNSEDNFSGSWNDLTDKPFEATYAYHIASDGNKEGLINYMGFYRVSDLVPSIEDFANGFVFKAAHESVEQVYTADDVSVGDMFWDGSTAIKFYQGPYFAVLQQDTTSPDNGTTLTRGTYFLSTTSLAHTLKVGKTNVLDDACISDNIARVGNIEDQIEVHNTSETAHSDIRDTISGVSALVGDTAVSEQINTAIEAIPRATWESLPDKPFGVVTKSVTNIGIPDDAVTDSEGQLVKVSNDTIPADIFTSTILSNEDFSMPVGSSQTYISEDIAVCEVMVVAYKENVTYTAGSTTYTYPEVGIYLPLASTVELTATWEETKLLDSNFIGSDIARVEDIPEGFSGSWNDLSDRPFYYDSNSEIIVEDLEAVTGTWTGTTDAGATASQIETMNDAFDVIFELGCQYKVTYNGVNYYVTATDDGYGNVCLGTYSYYELTETMPFSIHNYYNDYKGVYQFSGYVIGGAGSTHTFSVEKVDENILLLDEKYISDEIARISDIPSLDGLATETYVDTKFDTMVGDTPVSDQIEAAQIVYVGPTAPTDPNIKVWVNTSVEGTGVIPVLPRITTITLVEANWVGDSAPYSQVVEINTVTAVSKVDLQPTVSQIVSMQSDDIALMAENLDGVVTIYSFGGKPTGDMTMQVMLTEVSYV